MLCEVFQSDCKVELETSLVILFDELLEKKTPHFYDFSFHLFRPGKRTCDL